MPTLNHSTADNKFIISCHRTQLAQHVSSPTHYNNFTKLFFPSHNDLVSKVVINASFSTSDHNTISFEFLFSPNSVPGMVDSTNSP